MDFAKSISFKSLGENTTFLLRWQYQPYATEVQSDLLEGTTFEMLPLVVCTKGPIYKKGIETLLHTSYFLGIADPVHLDLMSAGSPCTRRSIP